MPKEPTEDQLIRVAIAIKKGDKPPLLDFLKDGYDVNAA